MARDHESISTRPDPRRREGITSGFTPIVHRSRVPRRSLWRRVVAVLLDRNEPPPTPALNPAKRNNGAGAFLPPNYPPKGARMPPLLSYLRTTSEKVRTSNFEHRTSNVEQRSAPQLIRLFNVRRSAFKVGRSYFKFFRHPMPHAPRLPPQQRTKNEERRTSRAQRGFPLRTSTIKYQQSTFINLSVVASAKSDQSVVTFLLSPFHTFIPSSNKERSTKNEEQPRAARLPRSDYDNN